MGALLRASFDTTLDLTPEVVEQILRLYKNLKALSALPYKDRTRIWKGLEEGDPARYLAQVWFSQEAPFPEELHLEDKGEGKLRVWGQEGFRLATLLIHLGLKIENSPLVVALSCSHAPPDYGGTACVLDKNTRHFGGTKAFVDHELAYALRTGFMKGEKPRE